MMVMMMMMTMVMVVTSFTVMNTIREFGIKSREPTSTFTLSHVYTFTLSHHQVKELVGWVESSNADFVVLGGDFNTSPTDDVGFHFIVICDIHDIHVDICYDELFF